jgi:death-on-curing protein
VTTEPEWVRLEAVLLCHGALIAAFGGTTGIRSRRLLESALARPRNVFAYESPDLFALAAAYAHGIVKNYPFVDGNKRVAFVVTRVFLGLNGVAFDPPEVEAVVIIEGLASGELAPDSFASWLRKHSRTARRRKRR